jgi:hypothetical protein
MSGDELFHPRDGRPVSEGEAIHTRDVVQAGAKFFVGAGLVHHLDQVGAAREIEAWLGWRHSVAPG